MKILLFGGNGQLGRELVRSLAVLGDVIALHSGSRDFCGDLANPDGISATVLAIHPAVVVNAAAFTDVDLAETQSELAHRLNAVAPGILASAASRVNAWFVHFSTDYVFDGSGDRPWVETDVAAPLNVYGRTKHEGDLRVIKNCSRHLVFRIGWLYSAHGKNFATSILTLAKEYMPLSVVDDQIGAPTGANMVADIAASVIGHVFEVPGLQGTYNVAPRGTVSRYGYACLLIEEALKTGWLAGSPTPSVHAVPSATQRPAAKRPANSRLDTAKLEGAFDIVLPEWQSGVQRLVKALQ